jgi:hypothetical protein
MDKVTLKSTQPLQTRPDFNVQDPHRASPLQANLQIYHFAK